MAFEEGASFRWVGSPLDALAVLGLRISGLSTGSLP